MYFLCIDTLSAPATLCLFDDTKTVIDTLQWDAHHAESDTLIESINTLITQHTLTYSDIAGILCLIGPGGFTGIRVTTLVANTLAFSFHMPLYPVTVDDFFRYQEVPLPWMIPLTKTEVLLWETSDQKQPIIVKKEEILHIKHHTSNQSSSPLSNQNNYFQANDYQLFLKNFPLPSPVSVLHPLYARDPNILLKK